MGIKHSRPVPPFMRYCSAIIPTMFDDSLSYYEALCALNNFIQKNLVEVINNNASVTQEYITLVDELKEYVKHYFDNLDVQEEINNKLDAMAEDGTLESLISEYITENLTNGYYNKAPYINYSRIMRRLTKTPNHPDYGDTDFYTMQGGVYLGNNIFVQANIRSFGVKLDKFNLETGTLIESNVLALQHCNSMTYDPNEDVIYATSLIDNSENRTHYLYKIDADDLTLIDTTEFTTLSSNEGLHSVAYDTVSQKLYVGVEYQGTNAFTVYEVVDGALVDCQLVNYRNILGPGGGNNDMCVNNGILYLLKHSPKTIVTFDLATKKCIQIYNLAQHNEKGYCLGEPENISYANDAENIIVGGYRQDAEHGWYYLQSYYTVAFDHGVQTALAFNAENSYGEINVWVDATSTSINPDGSYANRFKTIGEALDVVNRGSFKSLFINVADGTYPYVNMNGLNNIKIKGINTAPNVIVGGIRIYLCQNIYLDRMTISEHRNDDTYKYDMDIRNSSVELVTIRCSGTHDAHVYLYQSKVGFSSVTSTVSGTIYKIDNNVEMTPYSADQTMSMTDDSSSNVVFTKPILIGNANLSNTASSISTTGVEPLLKASNRRLKVEVNANYNGDSVEIQTQPTDGANKNFCVACASRLITCQCVFDYTNHAIKTRVTKAINIFDLTPTDVTSEQTGNYRIYYLG